MEVYSMLKRAFGIFLFSPRLIIFREKLKPLSVLSFKLQSEFPGEYVLEPAVHAVYVVLPAPYQIPEIIFCLDSFKTVDYIVTEFSKLRQVEPWCGALRAGACGITHEMAHVLVYIYPHFFACFQ